MGFISLILTYVRAFQYRENRKSEDPVPTWPVAKDVWSYLVHALYIKESHSVLYTAQLSLVPLPKSHFAEPCVFVKHRTHNVEE